MKILIHHLLFDIKVIVLTSSKSVLPLIYTQNLLKFIYKIFTKRILFCIKLRNFLITKSIFLYLSTIIKIENYYKLLKYFLSYWYVFVRKKIPISYLNKKTAKYFVMFAFIYKKMKIIDFESFT